MDDRTTRAHDNNDGHSVDLAEAPLALIFCSDLMFAVRLQTMARKTGYRIASIRPGTDIQHAAVLLVDIAGRGDWEAVIRQASNNGMAIIAFGPHMDTGARRRAKAAGATRVLANSNLERDLPGILIGIRNPLNTKHDRARSAED